MDFLSQFVYKLCTTRLNKKAALLILDFDNLTTLKMERDFQAPSFESNRSFLALFVLEILKNKIKNCKFGFRSNIRIHLLS